MNYWLILIPILSAFIGWMINSLIVWRLFHPVQSKKILGISLQGILPKKKETIAVKLGRLANKEFSFADLESKISSPANLERILPMIENHIDDFLRHRLGKEMPMISMFIGDKTISKMKEALMKEIKTLFPQVMSQYASNLKADINIENLVRTRISALDSVQLARTIKGSLHKELQLFKVAGALTGLLIGTIQVLITIFFIMR